ncbi:spore gernimation protein [Salicibibacter cibarius]|uniref:Spore gernimation protein n=1 Tax=Salicibibacter cibarius TaxID=2743000 RepID=A0A7T6Z2F6_9BACI|nr:spore morphogenesis/germination protein YwcE [Salicibibacter cibarius]QQK75471.1 spore gernimation protein [Salicibibacter cibarius]
MGVFFLYLFIASATPLFLWKEKRWLALASLPLLIVMWIMSGFYVANMLTPAAHTFFMILFSFNVLLAHVGAIILYVKPEWWKRFATD